MIVDEMRKIKAELKGRPLTDMNDDQRTRVVVLSIRKEIGVCLSKLGEVKKYPDNTSPTMKQAYHARLRQALLLKAVLRRRYPDLFNPRVRQTRLELKCTRSES
jgi:hypothetical protein